MALLAEIAGRLASGATTSEALVERALANAHSGEGPRTFIKVYDAAARAAARAADRLRSHGVTPSPLAGVPISIKDLFDVRGEPTPAGSKVLADAAPASCDAPVVARLRAAGAIIIGRTNMTEFAFSGLGINPHYGTPCNPFDRATGRIPGGSSSGAAVSVSDEMSDAGIGSDTGGSVRIPAALCGLVGFKPTAHRVPREGVLPLSTTLDSIGPIARSVACCALVDAIMAGDEPVVPVALPISGLRLGVVRDYVCERLEPVVATAFERALSILSAAGARLCEVPFSELTQIPALNGSGGFAGSEAYAWHRNLLKERGAEYDPRVAVRIAFAQGMSAADYIELGGVRARMIARAMLVTSPYDALLMPTTASIAPSIDALERDDDQYARANYAMLRNPTTINFLDGCALSIPCHASGDAPVGLMVAGMSNADQRILQVGQAIEAALGVLQR
ncbi:MAG: amidase [Betaproteobacteria bacterium]|nr:amidase [Betaproteobacteria bacterium]